jgi:hypothetical protein
MVHDPRVAFATLRLFGETLLPDRVSGILEMKPDAAARKGGGLLRKGDGSRTTARTGTWFVTTERQPLGNAPAAHLAWLVGLLTAHYEELRREVPDLQADLSLFVDDRDFDPASLPADLLKSAVKAGDLEIEVPERGLDIILTPRNVEVFIQDHHV